MEELRTIREVTEALLDGKEVEFMRTDGCEWKPLKSLLIPAERIDDKTERRYRIKPTKPSIDWSHVSDEFNFLARDSDDHAYLHTTKPERGSEIWVNSAESTVATVHQFKSYSPGNCDWKDSLVERPKN